MNHITYLGLDICTVFTQGQEYLELTGQVSIMDERTGQENAAGMITAVILSEEWSDQNPVAIAAGMNERLWNCIRCLEEYDLFVGKVGVILESEFTGEFRRYEDPAFVDLTYFLDRVLQVDHIITFLPTERHLKKQLGYQRTWGQDKRSYYIRTARQIEPRTFESMNTENYSQPQVGTTYNRLRATPDPSLIQNLSEEARTVVSVLESNGNKKLSKAEILKGYPFSEEDLSMAMLELIEYDLLEESVEQQLTSEPQQSENNTDNDELSILGEVQSRNITKVLELIGDGADINETTKDGKNALMIAIENKDQKMAETLLHEGIDPNYESPDGTTALKLCWRTQTRTIEQLLIRYGVKMGFE